MISGAAEQIGVQAKKATFTKSSPERRAQTKIDLQGFFEVAVQVIVYSARVRGRRASLRDINPLTDSEDYLDILENLGGQVAVIHQTDTPRLLSYSFVLSQVYGSVKQSIEGRTRYRHDSQIKKKIIERSDNVEEVAGREVFRKTRQRI